jgi:hypothetical protein
VDGSPILQAVVDRIVDAERAVLLVGDDEQELVLPVGWLPEGAGEGSVLTLGLALDAAAGAARADGLGGRLERLRRSRSRHGRFDDGGTADAPGPTA